ncbi:MULTISPECIES: sucrose-specific PTS transporter subunit IIBC [unclassified Bacillus (in: firmicutes)]|uniref:sucrose-specific PTS transporter subunit IIBC n=1 Tax=unclassified Bacillus (in: firmicutes) TaxID=185979 RepID=UPI0025549279|nr:MULTISPECIES: sucrose-specific PTS transporter subunit IIBC [unclassified Bacillus (in: firmicutes)]
MNIQDERKEPIAMAQSLIPLLGGKENIINMTHCTTRLRFELQDESKINKVAIDEMIGVHGTFSRMGLFQIILGPGIVNKVYRAILETKPTPVSVISNTEPPKVRMNPFIQFARTLSNIFVPIIPAIVASGLLMGLIGMIKVFQWAPPDSSLMKMLDIFSSAAFIILPILIGFCAAKEFGGNPILGAVIGGILTHPSLLNPSKLGYKVPEYMEFLGVDIPLIGYQGTVIPILISVFFMSKLELRLRKIVPSALDLFFIPFLVIICIGSISLLVIGPISLFIGDMMTNTFQLIYQSGGAIAGFLFGGLYSLIVVTGLHHTLHAVEMELLANPKIGVNFLLPIWSMANMAQGGAGLAVFFKTKNERLKKIAIPSAFSAFLGIIEPVIFGINIKLFKPFIGAAIGGAFGGAYVVLTHVVANSYGLTGIPMIAIVAPLGISNLMHYLIGLGISVITAFIATLILWEKEET